MNNWLFSEFQMNEVMELRDFFYTNAKKFPWACERSDYTQAWITAS